MDIRLPSGKVIKNIPEGTSREAIQQKAIKAGLATPDDFATPINEVADKQPSFADRLKRSAGVNVRAAVQGAPALLDALTFPARYGYGKLAGEPTPPSLGEMAGGVMDTAGLPAPANPTERVISDITGAVSAGGGLLGLAKAIPSLMPLAEGGLQQLFSAGGAGGGAGLAREGGFGPGGQIAGALAGGLLAPATLHGTIRGGQKVQGMIPQWSPYSDDAINAMFGKNGIDLSGMTVAARNHLLAQARDAMKTGGELNPEYLRRLADFERVGATATRGRISLDPIQVTKEKNLAKTQANQGVGGPGSLPYIENQNNRAFIDTLNRLGADTTDDMLATGGKITGSIKGVDDALKAKESMLYGQARDSSGRALGLNRTAFVNRVDKLLTENNKRAFLPAEVKKTINTISKGQVVIGGKAYDVPFNVDTIDQLKTMIATAQRSTKDGNVRAALGSVRDALDNTPLAEGSKEAMKAFNEARTFARNRRMWQESSPGIKAALDDATPDTFFEKYILSKTAGVADAKNTLNALKADPAALESARQQTTAWLKSKALSNAADEVGNFSQAAYNKELSKIGLPKLRLLFSNDEIAQLKSLGRASSYEMFYPKGSAVNTSNTAAMMFGKTLDLIGNSPFIKPLVTDPAKSLLGQVGAYRAQKVPQSLLLPSVPMPGASAAKLIYPGLLSTQALEQ